MSVRADPAWRAFRDRHGTAAVAARLAQLRRERDADRQRRIAEHARTHRCSLAEAEREIDGD